MTWVREGYCCKCGQCCRCSSFNSSVVIDDLPLQHDGSCPHLKPEVNGERLCAVHDTVDTYWARGCNVWPSNPTNIENYDRCTFSFRWED
jgi:hypothetical protein